MNFKAGMNRAHRAPAFPSCLSISGKELIEMTSLPLRPAMNSAYQSGARIANARFFQPDQTDVLVRYDEEREKTGVMPCHRAYFALTEHG